MIHNSDIASTPLKANGWASLSQHSQPLYVARCTDTPKRLVLVHENKFLNKVVIAIADHRDSHESILEDSCNAVISFLSQAKVSPNRLLYIATGIIFDARSPPPFGGPKARPGYIAYKGRGALPLLQFILTSSFKWYISSRGPQALQFVVASINKALVLHRHRGRDFLNELMLRGMKRAGHIEWSKVARIPQSLQHVAEIEAVSEGVRFTPKRWEIGDAETV
ncbi:hypothetical protein BC830DRAFT_1116151 [Chytriomyces sp. MP71]|nr:hypothetical protein BC830DRAFT_1116151 [Chytriomyces sp. MP71]